ncbi:MAG TPA: hypothetical protein VEU51_14415 [Candidatus Acidoferrales bacterium]|nr:hypothetical protein [Candidatus Acidoferrales bacterium]
MKKRRQDGGLPPARSRAHKKSEASSEETAVTTAIIAALKEVALFDPELAKTLRNEIKGRKILHYKPT